MKITVRIYSNHHHTNHSVDVDGVFDPVKVLRNFLPQHFTNDDFKFTVDAWGVHAESGAFRVFCPNPQNA